MSIAYPMWPLTKYPNDLDKNYGNIRTNLINYSERDIATDSIDSTKHMLTAGDVLALQQAIFAVQEVLGFQPQGGSATVKERIAALENPFTLDLRYGGAGWSTLGTKPTILSHRHLGTSESAAKINLATEVTGVLPVGNINLATVNAGTLYMDGSGTTTISTAIAGRLAASGGTVAGTLSVSGRLVSRTQYEVDAATVKGLTGTIATDATADSGQCVSATSAMASGTLVSTTADMRFMHYVVALRMKVSNVSETRAIGTLEVRNQSAAGTLVESLSITPSLFKANNTWQMVYLAFAHDGPSKTLHFGVKWNGTGVNPVPNSNAAIDSIVVLPLHMAAYDKDRGV